MEDTNIVLSLIFGFIGLSLVLIGSAIGICCTIEKLQTNLQNSLEWFQGEVIEANNLKSDWLIAYNEPLPDTTSQEGITALREHFHSQKDEEGIMLMDAVEKKLYVKKGRKKSVSTTNLPS